MSGLGVDGYILYILYLLMFQHGSYHSNRLSTVKSVCVCVYVCARASRLPGL